MLLNFSLLSYHLLVRYLHFLLHHNRSGSSPLDISRFPRNKDIYLLGTSMSILDLTDKSFDIIRDSFSIGINGFCFHSFVPNIYAVEFSVSCRWNSALHAQLLTQLHNSSQATVLLRENSSSSNFSLPKDRCLSYSILRPPNLIQPKLLNFIQLSSKTLSIIRLPLLLGFLSTLDRLLYLSLYLRPTSITLVGVDLSSASHFYESSHSVSPAPSATSIQSHPTYSSDYKGTNLITIIQYYNQLFRNIGVPIYVESSSSALNCILPIRSLR